MSKKRNEMAAFIKSLNWQIRPLARIISTSQITKMTICSSKLFKSGAQSRTKGKDLFMVAHINVIGTCCLARWDHCSEAHCQSTRRILLEVRSFKIYQRRMTTVVPARNTNITIIMTLCATKSLYKFQIEFIMYLKQQRHSDILTSRAIKHYDKTHCELKVSYIHFYKFHLSTIKISSLLCSFSQIPNHPFSKLSKKLSYA